MDGDDEPTALRPGTVDSVKVVIFGGYGRLLRGEGTMRTLRWDADLVRVNVSGNWCYVDEVVPGRDGDVCPPSALREVDADVWMPFGDAYDLTNPYVEIDAPVQALYREELAGAVFGPGFELPGGLPGTSTDGPPADDGGSASGDVVEFVCDCSCDGFAEVESALEELDQSDEDDVSQADMAQMMQLGQCAMSCAGQWATCEE